MQVVSREDSEGEGGKVGGEGSDREGDGGEGAKGWDEGEDLLVRLHEGVSDPGRQKMTLLGEGRGGVGGDGWVGFWMNRLRVSDS